MRRFLRIAVKTAGGLALVTTVLVALDVTVLAYPQPFFRHAATFGDFTVHADRPVPASYAAVIVDAESRLAAMEFPPAPTDYDIYVCHDEGRYALFTRLARRGPDSLAMGLYYFGNIFLNVAKLERMAAGNTAGIRHSRYEGDPAEAIAHEIAHFTMVERLGHGGSQALPVWKSEGYAEYQANLTAGRDEPWLDLRERVGLLRDDSVWGQGDSPARRMYAWHLMVEWLAAERNVGLDDLAAPDVVEADVRRAMLAWHRRVGP